MQMRNRHSEHFSVIPTRTDVYKFSFFPSTIPIWNTLPSSTVKLPSTKTFSKKVIYHLQWPVRAVYRLSSASRCPCIHRLAQHQVFNVCTLSYFCLRHHRLRVVISVYHRLQSFVGGDQSDCCLSCTWCDVLHAGRDTVNDGLPRIPVDVDVEIFFCFRSILTGQRSCRGQIAKGLWLCFMKHKCSSLYKKQADWLGGGVPGVHITY